MKMKQQQQMGHPGYEYEEKLNNNI